MNSALSELSPREVEVMEELSQWGHGNKTIADNIGIAERTVKDHLTNAMEKLGAINRTHAVIVYLQLKAERKWIQDHGPDELYNKFRVWSNRKQRWIDEDEFIFVMRPETDKYAWGALNLYAAASSTVYPNRAEQIRKKLQEIRERNGA